MPFAINFNNIVSGRGLYTVSIIATNVDPAVKEGSPAATSRGNAIAAARIFGAPPRNHGRYYLPHSQY
jgi:hypothetical protein